MEGTTSMCSIANQRDTTTCIRSGRMIRHVEDGPFEDLLREFFDEVADAGAPFAECGDQLGLVDFQSRFVGVGPGLWVVQEDEDV